MSRILRGDSGEAKDIKLSSQTEAVAGAESLSFQRMHSSDFISVTEAQSQLDTAISDLRIEMLEEAKKEIEEPVQNIKSLLAELSSLRQQVFENSEKEILDLLQLLSKKLFAKEMILQPDILKNLIKNSLNEMLKEREIDIKINPKDHEYLKTSLDELQQAGVQIRLTEDRAVDAGCAELVSKNQKVDLDIDKVIDSFFSRVREEKSEVQETGDEGDKL